MSMSEHDVQNLIRMHLANKGIPCFRVNVGKVRLSDGRWFDTGVPKGFSDLFGFRHDGKVFFIEVKNESGQPSDDQLDFIDFVKSKGAIAGICRSVNDVEELLNGK